MNKKTIKLVSHGPHQYQHMKDILVSWEDVWIKFHCRRRLVKIAPCFCSYENLLKDIKVSEEILDKFPEEEWEKEFSYFSNTEGQQNERKNGTH